METEVLGVTDYIVLAIMLLISSLIGIYYRFTGGKQKTRLDTHNFAGYVNVISVTNARRLKAMGVNYPPPHTHPTLTPTPNHHHHHHH